MHHRIDKWTFARIRSTDNSNIDVPCTVALFRLESTLILLLLIFFWHFGRRVISDGGRDYTSSRVELAQRKCWGNLHFHPISQYWNGFLFFLRLCHSIVCQSCCVYLMEEYNLWTYPLEFSRRQLTLHLNYFSRIEFKSRSYFIQKPPVFNSRAARI